MVPTYKQVQVVRSVSIRDVPADADASEESQTSIRTCWLESGKKSDSYLPPRQTGAAGENRAALGRAGGSCPFWIPRSVLSFSRCTQYTVRGLEGLSIYWQVVLKSVWDYLGILAKIPLWLCDFCVKCLQKQSVVRMIIKKTWEKRFRFFRGVGERGREEQREEWRSGWGGWGGGYSVTVVEAFLVLRAWGPLGISYPASRHHFGKVSALCVVIWGTSFGWSPSVLPPLDGKEERAGSGAGVGVVFLVSISLVFLVLSTFWEPNEWFPLCQNIGSY